MGDLMEADIEQYYQGGRRMPYIATWSEEQIDTAALKWLAGGRLGYTDETPQDRVRGVLLLRQGSARGRGSANPAVIHPHRQPEVMERLGCQICGADTTREAAELWKGRRLLLAAEGTSLHEGAQTAVPPVHCACAIEALTERIGCTQLGTPVIGLAETVTPWGVDGLVHDPLTREPLDRHTLPYDDPLARATIAYRVVVTLHGYAPITREDLEAAA